MDHEYNVIEKHMSLAKELYTIDEKSKYIMSQFDAKKSKGIRRSGNYIFSDSIKLIYKNIQSCSSLKRFRTFFHLQYFLDELLFDQARTHTKFYVEDDVYDLSKLYFHQGEWVTDLNIQPYEFYEDDSQINIHEAMYLICYLKEFEHLLHDIEIYIKTIKHMNIIKNKLKYAIHRIKKKHKKVWSVLLSTISHNFGST